MKNKIVFFWLLFFIYVSNTAVVNANGEEGIYQEAGFFESIMAFISNNLLLIIVCLVICMPVIIYFIVKATKFK